MKRVCIVANVSKTPVAQALELWRPWVAQRAQIIAVETDGSDDLSQLDADLVLVLGGDGTLLSVARRLRGRPIPMMGVNFGRLGFLAGFTPDNFQKHFEQYLSNRLPVSTRQMLEASVVSGDLSCPIDDFSIIQARRNFTATAL